MAVFVERGSDGKIEATGADRVKFLHGLLSNDIRKLAPGQACMAALLDGQAHVHSIVAVAAREDKLLLRVPPGHAAKVLTVLGRFIISEDVALRDVSSEWTVFTVLGPCDKPGAFRTDEFGPPTFDVWTRPGERPLEGKELDAAGFEARRIEAGVPAFGLDLDATILLPEAGLERWASYDKGCYLGQEIVARVKYRGRVNRKLSGLIFEGGSMPARDAAVARGGVEIGRVTSAAWSPAFKKNLALAYLRSEAAEPGTEVEVGPLRARVSSLPFSS